ncbi:DNA-binding protein [Cordyceps fumosorosea ARSEF 2679]|uniref:DNA-binding protein n=1 Tax=Cordyceps fumosorosea (strain ARSEF 2679) TaxID=1081104 RepID=A0A162MW81_CORFA|nr:DNA-binding protein [Cordyceps fumosorosea ARSEF 2679]OAA71559.1 DNA-binding protein [Cordyceps fumosorosea ARSEF 2679]
MPFVANTPESLLARSDSKNPKSTCRGITSAGRPCRRPLGARPDSTHRLTAAPDDPADESLYCWQHKEQASSHSARSSPGPKPPTIREERTSLDTLADRLGLVDVGSTGRPDKPGRRPHGGREEGVSAYPAGFESKPVRHSRPQQQQKKKKKQKQQQQQTSQLAFCCCFSLPIQQVEDEPEEKPKPRPSNKPYQPEPMPTHQPQRPPTSRPPPYRPPLPSPAKSSRSDVSVTAQLKRLIPNSLDAATAALLMAELVRPITESDEPGYIYMFWLVQEAGAADGDQHRRAPVEAARSLLAPPPSTPRGRRASDAVSRYASQSSPGGRRKTTMLLKIGRAANVQRRMNQWQRQCGYDVEVLRYYPYASSSTPTPSPGRHGRGSDDDSSTPLPAGAMTPHAKRVERLVHIELTGMGLRAERETCKACGRDHREWFEVGATREDVRRVDEVIRRWVEWDCRED